jgi:hypothetical protein
LSGTKRPFTPHQLALPLQPGVGFEQEETWIQTRATALEQRLQLDGKDGKQEFLESRTAGFWFLMALE